MPQAVQNENIEVSVVKGSGRWNGIDFVINPKISEYFYSYETIAFAFVRGVKE